MVFCDTSDAGSQAPERARQAARDALVLAKEAGNKGQEAAALMALARSEFVRQRSKAQASNAALDLAHELGETKADAAISKFAGSEDSLRDGSENTLKGSSQVSNLSQSLKDRRLYVDCLTNVFATQCAVERPSEALRLAREGLELMRGLGDRRGQADLLLISAAALLELGGNFEAPARAAREALVLLQGLGDREGVLVALNALINVFDSQTPMQTQSMLEVCKEGLEHFRSRGDKEGIASALKLRAAVSHATAERAELTELASSEAAAAFRELGDTNGEASVWQSAVFAHLGRSEHVEALKAAQEALAVYQIAGNRPQQVRVLDAIANLHLLRENTSRALKISDEARSIAQDMGDDRLTLAVLSTLGAAHLVRGDHSAALTAANEVLALNRKLGNREGEASALMLVVKVQLALGDAEEAIRSGRKAMHILSESSDRRGQLAVTEFLAQVLLQQKRSGEAAPLAREALELARDLHDKFSEGNALFLVGKCDLRSADGLRSIHDASKLFRKEGFKKAEATAMHAAANSCLLQQPPRMTDALQMAEEGMAIFKGIGDVRGEAIMLQTLANCYLLFNDTERGTASAYKALQLFADSGDDYGRGIAKKLLLGLGQSEGQIAAAASGQSEAPEVAQFDGLESKGSADAEKKRQDEEAKAIMEEQVVWEYAWVPQETQDPKFFGEKHDGRTRRIFMASELRDSKLLRQLATCHAGAAGKKTYFGNLINGRLVTASSLQSGMEASQCAAVVYDVTKLNNLTQLEVMDVALRLVQAFQPIEEPSRVALDVILESTQTLSMTKGVREPFHSTLWGYCRTARIENPLHEFRVLDLDAARRKQDMAFVCRYLQGAQSVRPVEAIVRNGALQVARLVNARMLLKLPMKVEVRTK